MRPTAGAGGSSGQRRIQEDADASRHAVTMENDHRLRLADDRTLACLELGAPAGRPVLYFHGYPGSRFEARIVARIATHLNIRLLAPDRPGLGASAFQPGRTIGAWGADMRQLADQFALARFAVLGVSGGGPYALSCAAHMPERLSRVALVGAVCPVRGELTAEMPAIQRFAFSAALHAPPLAWIALSLAARVIRRHPQLLLWQMLARTGSADRALLADPHYRALMLSSTVESLQQGGRGVAHELGLLARRWDVELEGILTPVAIWQGLADTVVPIAMARHLARVLVNSELHCLADEGHLSWIVRHGERVFADLVREN